MTRQSSFILTVGLVICAASAWAQPSNVTVKPNTTPGTIVNGAPAVPTTTNDLSKIFKNKQEEFSYALGMSWGAGLKGN